MFCAYVSFEVFDSIFPALSVMCGLDYCRKDRLACLLDRDGSGIGEFVGKYFLAKESDLTYTYAYISVGFILDHREVLVGLYEDCKDTGRGCVSAGMGIALRANGPRNASGAAGVEGYDAEDWRLPATHCRRRL